MSSDIGGTSDRETIASLYSTFGPQGKATLVQITFALMTFFSITFVPNTFIQKTFIQKTFVQNNFFSNDICSNDNCINIFASFPVFLTRVH